MNLLAWMVIVIGGAAAVDDLRRGMIADRISLAAAACGLGYHVAHGGLSGLGASAAGGAIGFSVFLMFYLLGGMGGGDIKLMGGLGCLLEPRGILTAAMLAAIAGACFAAGSALFRSKRPSIPYAPAIVLGSWLALLAGR
jgi:prepilin peptidase CpaA